MADLAVLVAAAGSFAAFYLLMEFLRKV